MIIANGLKGKTTTIGPDEMIGSELLMVIEALTENDIVKHMVHTARDLNKMDILFNFAKAITDEL